jgi:hypothetical protein
MRSMTGSCMLFVLICSSQHAAGQRYGHIAQPNAMVNNYNAAGSSGGYCASCNAGTPAANQHQGVSHQAVSHQGMVYQGTVYQGMAHQGACCSPDPCCSQGCDPCYGGCDPCHRGCLGQRCYFGRFFDRLCELERRKNQWLFGGYRGCGFGCNNACNNACYNDCNNNCYNDCNNGGYVGGY